MRTSAPNVGRRRLAGAAVAALALLIAADVSSQPPTHQLLVVIDGLRPDYVTPALMPRLHALGARGVVFEANHSVFPTVTRVNASSIATGAYPETHGLLGNVVYSPKTFPAKGVNTSNYAELEAMARAEGRLLDAPTLGDSLARAGKRFLVFSAGSTGSAFLLGQPHSQGAVVNPDYVIPSELAARVTEALGPGPAEAVPNHARNKWVVDAYLSFGLTAPADDVAAIWLGDPDATAHQQGIGSDLTTTALRQVDAEIGRIEDTLRARGLLDRTNIIVTSDHGFSTHTGELRLAALVAPFTKALEDGSADIVVTEGAVNFRGATDPARVVAVVGALQKRPEVGAIFTRPVRPGSSQGQVPGTLSFEVARWGHSRSAEILVSGNWTATINAAGYAGTTTLGGVAGHGTSSVYDIHNALIVAGPDFRERTRSAVPTSNVDIAPTILKVLRLAQPTSMSGRPIDEALKGGPTPHSVRIDRLVQSARTADGSYQLDAHISVVDGRRYLDYTEVRRP